MSDDEGLFAAPRAGSFPSAAPSEFVEFGWADVSRLFLPLLVCHVVGVWWGKRLAAEPSADLFAWLMI